jgi:uncharacterized protein YjiS (DUF1127 family)
MSTSIHALTRAPLGTAAARPRPAAAGSRLRRALDLIVEWRARARDRRELASLDDRSLRDMGLDRAAIWAECEKPWWRP